MARPVGTKQPLKVKLSTGVLIFVLLVILIWFPLLLMTSGTPAVNGNPIYKADVRIGIRGWEPFYQMNTDSDIVKETDMTNAQIKDLKSLLLRDEVPNSQLVLCATDSESLWQPTPPNQESMLNSLANPLITNSLEMTVSYTRNNPPERLTIDGSISVPLASSSAIALASLINGTNTTGVYIDNIGPRYARLPNQGNVQFIAGTKVSAILHLHVQEENVTLSNGKNMTQVQKWWSVTQVPSGPYEDSQIQLIAVSAEVPKAFAATFAQNGLIGIYVSIVLSVGRFLRLWVADLVSRIYLDDMPRVDDLMIMCEDIFIARQYNDLLLEEHLYRELMQLFRHPQRLIDITKKKDS